MPSPTAGIMNGTATDRRFFPEVGEPEMREAFRAFPAGVVAVCARVDGRPVGLTIASFLSVSMRPPLVAFGIQHSSSTWPVLCRAPFLGVSVLSGDHEQIARVLASRTGDRFSGLAIETTERDAVMIVGAPVWFECSQVSSVPAGDHQIVLMNVHAVATLEYREDPLILFGSGFRRLGRPGPAGRPDDTRT